MKHKTTLIAAACVAGLAFLPADMPAASKKKEKTEPAASASPAASSSPAAAKAPRAIPFHGMISAVDQSAKTFTITGKTSSRVFKITDKTVITKSGAPAVMKDIAANEEVAGSYWKQADGSLEAKTVKLGPKAAGEKKEKKSKKPKEESSPAAEASPKA